LKAWNTEPILKIQPLQYLLVIARKITIFDCFCFVNNSNWLLCECIYNCNMGRSMLIWSEIGNFKQTKFTGRNHTLFVKAFFQWFWSNQHEMAYMCCVYTARPANEKCDFLFPSKYPRIKGWNTKFNVIWNRSNYQNVAFDWINLYSFAKNVNMDVGSKSNKIRFFFWRKDKKKIK
jgi:hypothetical protein